MRTKTLNQIIEDGYNFPEIVPLDLRGVITEWFGLRHVVDDNNFERFFNRILKRDLHRYNEIIRIEAGNGLGMTAGYDWLVNMYMEKESVTDTHNETENNVTNAMTGTVTDINTPRATTGGSVTETKSYNSGESTQHGLKVEFEPLSHRFTKRGSTEHDEEVVENAASATSGNATSTAKSTPASILATYDDGSESSASATSNGVSSTLGKTPAWDTELSAPTAISKAINNQTTNNGINRTLHTEDAQTTNDESYGTGKDTTTNSGTDTRSRTGADTTTTVTTQTKDGIDTLEKTYDTSNSITTTDESDGASRLREIYTGRGGENMASALEKAREYIVTTSAWNWLMNQLEPCFMAVYDI